MRTPLALSTGAESPVRELGWLAPVAALKLLLQRGNLHGSFDLPQLA